MNLIILTLRTSVHQDMKRVKKQAFRVGLDIYNTFIKKGSNKTI